MQAGKQVGSAYPQKNARRSGPGRRQSRAEHEAFYAFGACLGLCLFWATHAEGGRSVPTVHSTTEASGRFTFTEASRRFTPTEASGRFTFTEASRRFTPTGVTSLDPHVASLCKYDVTACFCFLFGGARGSRPRGRGSTYREIKNAPPCPSMARNMQNARASGHLASRNERKGVRCAVCGQDVSGARKAVDPGSNRPSQTTVLLQDCNIASPHPLPPPSLPVRP